MADKKILIVEDDKVYEVVPGNCSECAFRCATGESYALYSSALKKNDFCEILREGYCLKELT